MSRDRLNELRAKYSKRERLEQLRKKHKKPKEDTNFSDHLKAGAMGALQGATLGLSDEAWAGTQAVLKELYEAVGGPESDFKEAYSTAVEANRDEIKALAEKAPGAYIGGELASLLIPGMGIAKAAGGAGKLAKIAKGIKDASLTKKGIALGTVEGASRGEGLEGKVAGAALGAAIAPAIKYAGPIIGTTVGGATGGLGGAAAGLGGSVLARKLGKKALEKLKNKKPINKDTAYSDSPVVLMKKLKNEHGLMPVEEIQKLPAKQRQAEYLKHTIYRERTGKVPKFKD